MNRLISMIQVTLYYFAQVNDHIVVGTGNRVEDYGVGFFTKYGQTSIVSAVKCCISSTGDGGVDISPIGDLLKSEVRAIGKELDLDQSIIDAPPTDGLFGDMRTDEDQIGATYDEIEWAMKQHETNENPTMNERQKRVMEIYLQRHRANQHKLREIPRCRIPKELKHSAAH